MAPIRSVWGQKSPDVPETKPQQWVWDKCNKDTEQGAYHNFTTVTYNRDFEIMRKLTRHFIDKPTCSQSHQGLVNFIIINIFNRAYIMLIIARTTGIYLDSSNEW